ncbi:MAG TPA: alanine--glyoxylate aminotransferase family protein [Chloroflexia bacterium]|nr:alanine--glyoxylate aminotransferase family protein [Chloroflexia bacterium]
MAIENTSASAAAPTRPPKRLLLGPGPSEVDPEVLASLALPPLGHLDPALLAMMGELQEMLRSVFQTKNRLTLALSGTGTSGMEAALANSIEAGDGVVVGVAGYFGDRMCQIVQRLGGRLTRVDAEWGTALDPQQMRDAIRQARPRVVCAVHAETSTGVCQDLAEIVQVAHEVDALVVVDAVTSLGGQPLRVDEWGIDVCYSGSQKCLGAPSGLAPFTMNARALEKASRRSSPLQTFYLDAVLLSKYWDERQYHHTISAPLIYSLHTALRLLHEEGLEERWRRHHLNHRAFRAGVEGLGLGFLPDEEISLWPLNAIRLSDNLDEAAIRAILLNEHGIEVGGGLGPLKGKLLRVGLMGYGSQQGFVLQLLAALEQTLKGQEHILEAGAGLAGAMAVYQA